MDALYSVLWYLLVAGLCLLVLVGILAMWFIASCVRQFEKFTFDLPWLRWMTLEELEAKGFSPFWARLLLPSFHRDGELDVRPRNDRELSEAEQDLMERFGFRPMTVQCYEFCLTKRHKRKKPKLKDLLKSWAAVPTPAPVRA